MLRAATYPATDYMGGLPDTPPPPSRQPEDRRYALAPWTSPCRRTSRSTGRRSARSSGSTSPRTSRTASTRSGTFHSPELNKALAERGFIERAIPGLGRGDPIELWVLFNELEKAGAPYDGLANAVMISGVISHVGTEWQKEQVLPGVIAGETVICLGYSEPDYGSDVASIVTRAVRDGDEWVINGAKMWTTMAHVADWVILLTRTDLDLPKHRGLTMFLLPMTTPGITVERVSTMATERTNATFYDNVRVGDEYVLGEVNGGWRAMTVALAFERGVMGGTNVAVPLLRHLRAWAERTA